jgi:protein-disulfide isomerase
MLVFLGGIAVVLVAAVGLYQWFGTPTVSVPQPQATSAPASTPAGSGGEAAKVRADDFVIGSPSAPVTVIEYASLTCPHCRNFHENILPALKSAYVDGGKVRVVYRDFPLDGLALRASMLARCSGRERFFGFLDILFKRQAQWAGSPDPLAALAQVAALGGLNADDFKACLENKTIENQVLAQRQEAEKAFAIVSTPSFIVNGRKVSVGATIADFKAILDPLVAKGGK